MLERGLSVLGPRGDIHLSPVRATDDPASIDPVDYVIFCVKLWDVESAGAACRPLVGPTTAVIPLQNGIDASERLIPILGKDTVMGGVAQISATVAEPGVIRQTGPPAPDAPGRESRNRRVKNRHCKVIGACPFYLAAQN